MLILQNIIILSIIVIIIIISITIRVVNSAL